jgi:hypothetical protein
MDVAVALEPAVVFSLMRVKVVEDDVEGLVGWVFSDNLVHEVEEIDTAAAPIMARSHQTGGPPPTRRTKSRCRGARTRD